MRSDSVNHTHTHSYIYIYIYIYMLILDMDPLYDVGKVPSFTMIDKIVDCGWALTSISFTTPIIT